MPEALQRELDAFTVWRVKPMNQERDGNGAAGFRRCRHQWAKDAAEESRRDIVLATCGAPGDQRPSCGARDAEAGVRSTTIPCYHVTMLLERSRALLL